MSSLGAGVGGLVHAVAATLGLSALVMQSMMAFCVLKYFGAAYLVYLGIRTLLELDEEKGVSFKRKLTSLAVFKQGVLTDLLNPKTALFFLAFIPQFVKLESGRVTLQFFVYGLLAMIIFTIVEIVVAVMVGHLSKLFAARGRWRRACQINSGVALIILGGFVAIAEQK